MTTLIFSNTSYWETNFIIHKLFPKNTRILFSNPTTFIDPNFYIENNVEIGNCCLLFSTNEVSFDDILNISILLKPLIILQMSDEDGRRGEYIPLASVTKLLIRQYYFSHYDYSKYKNILYIPLGYQSIKNDYFKDDYIHKPSNERKYDWSFIGDSYKHNRSAVLYDLSLSKLNRYCIGNGISSDQMLDIYSESIFVPSCRGNVTIDCFRTYEACSCGAIPIVVGDMDEIMSTYSMEKNPPWIFASNWQDAIKECCHLIDFPELLVKKQRKNISWWETRLYNCQQCISTNLEKNDHGYMSSFLLSSSLSFNNKKKIQIVIARYKENLDWTKNLSNVFICNKGLPMINDMYGHQIINDLKNVGREGHTFYSYIYDNYYNLCDYTVFLQGNPFDHCPEILDKLQELNHMDSPPEFAFFAICVSEIFLGYNIFYPDLNCHLNFKKTYEEIFQKIPSDELMMRRFTFGSGAQFIVSRSNILSRPRDFYKRIINMLSYNSDPIEGHIIERFHKIILSSCHDDDNKISYDSILGRNYSI